MTFLFTPHPTSAIPLQGSDHVFPVHRIYCVGQNYSDHVKEMGGDPRENLPVFFSKPSDAVVIDNKPVTYPPATSNLHYEVELVVALASGGINISVGDALSHVLGYAVGIDFTRRDLQTEAKKQGRPWDAAKGFDQSAPTSAIRLVNGGDLASLYLPSTALVKQRFPGIPFPCKADLWGRGRRALNVKSASYHLCEAQVHV